VVSTIPRIDSTHTLLAALDHWHFDGLIAVTAHTEADADRLRVTKADIVLEPFTAAGDVAARGLVEHLQQAD